jgi:hypothetical protein
LPGEFRQFPEAQAAVPLAAGKAGSVDQHYDDYYRDGRRLRQAPKRKWFQVTLVAACSPAGMHGPNMAFRSATALPPSLPATALDRHGSVLRKLPGISSDEADVSKRPFACPQRLPFQATSPGS